VGARHNPETDCTSSDPATIPPSDLTPPPPHLDRYPTPNPHLTKLAFIQLGRRLSVVASTRLSIAQRHLKTSAKMSSEYGTRIIGVSRGRASNTTRQQQSDHRNSCMKMVLFLPSIFRLPTPWVSCAVEVKRKTDARADIKRISHQPEHRVFIEKNGKPISAFQQV
jgi:hypothetical protein